jgi:hypothetical protein
VPTQLISAESMIEFASENHGMDRIHLEFQESQSKSFEGPTLREITNGISVFLQMYKRQGTFIDSGDTI